MLAKFTTFSGKSIFINVNQIESISASDKDQDGNQYTKIFMVGEGSDVHFRVSGDVDNNAEKINSCKRNG